jgi:gamma-glutamyl-gamma-aminobutyrate hydrolase PuuD
MNDTVHMVNSYHSQGIARLAPGFDVVATDQDGNPEAFRHVMFDIWGVVWHPERQLEPILPPDLANFLRTEQSPF